MSSDGRCVRACVLPSVMLFPRYPWSALIFTQLVSVMHYGTKMNRLGLRSEGQKVKGDHWSSGRRHTEIDVVRRVPTVCIHSFILSHFIFGSMRSYTDYAGCTSIFEHLLKC